MSRIIGDRKEKSILEEMAEVSREFNEQCREEERRKDEINARREAKRKEKGIPEQAKAPSKKIPVKEKPKKTIYSWMEIEPKAEMNYNLSPILKQERTYTGSLLELRKRGYLRHCYPADAFAIICDGLEGKLDSALKPVSDDMISGVGEWLSMAWERKGNLLIAYLHPEGFSLDGGINNPDERSTITYTSKMEFDITGKQSNSWIPLKEMSDEFNEFIYSRKYADLPKAMQEGRFNAHVMLPPDDLNIYPIARKNGTDAYSITYNMTYSGSRGIRTRRKK